MKQVLFLISLLALIKSHPQITIKENGKPKQVFVPGFHVSTINNQIHIPYNGRGYLAIKNSSGFAADMYYSPKLLGGYIQYDIDISDFGCSCNAGVYLVSMPGYDANQNPDPSKGGDYYCDANKVQGVWCPEMDLMEANRYSLQVTPHVCDNPTGKYYQNCDRAGCGQNLWDVDSSVFGINKRISSLNKFTIGTHFVKQNGILAYIKTDFWQNNNSFSSNRTPVGCKWGYLEQMGKDLSRGMTPVITSWGTDYAGMQWLDGKTGCTGACQNGQHGTPVTKVSNIEIWTTEQEEPENNRYYCVDKGLCVRGTRGYADYISCMEQCTTTYDFGEICDQQMCAKDCPASSCKWSWPKDDPQTWYSSQAQCRCHYSAIQS